MDPYKDSFRRYQRRGGALRMPWGSLFLFLMVGGIVFGYYYWAPLSSAPPSSRGKSQAHAAQAEEEDPDPATAFAWKDRLQILLLGTDGVRQQGLSDTLILLLVDLNTNRVAALSIPRDTRVYIPGYGFRKINDAFSLGGAELALQTVGRFLGRRPDYYIRTDLAGFKAIINTLGGVDLCVEKRMYYRDRAQGLYIDLQPGPQHLDGEHAMQYVRFRNDARGDWGRMERQQKLLRALARKALAPENLPKLPLVLRQLMDNVETNLSLRQVLALGQALQDLEPEQVVAEQFPTRPERIGGIDYLIPTEDGSRVVSQLLRRMNEKPRVFIGNGSHVIGLATQVASLLREKGYEVIGSPEVTDFDQAQTTVIDVAQKAEVAAHVAALVGGQVDQPEPVELGDLPVEADVVVILGEDYAEQHVTAPVPQTPGR